MNTRHSCFCNVLRSLLSSVGLFLMIFLLSPLTVNASGFISSVTTPGDEIWVVELRTRGDSDSGTAQDLTLNLEYVNNNGKTVKSGEYSLNQKFLAWNESSQSQKTIIQPGTSYYATFRMKDGVKSLTKAYMDVHSGGSYDNIRIDYINFYKLTGGSPVGELFSSGGNMIRTFSGIPLYHMNPSDGVNDSLFDEFEEKDIWDDSTFTPQKVEDSFISSTSLVYMPYVLDLYTAQEGGFNGDMDITIYGDRGTGVENVMAEISLSGYALEQGKDKDTTFVLRDNSLISIAFTAPTYNCFKGGEITRVVFTPKGSTGSAWVPHCFLLTTGGKTLEEVYPSLEGVTASMLTEYPNQRRTVCQWLNSSRISIKANENTDIKSRNGSMGKTLDSTELYIPGYALSPSPAEFDVVLRTKDTRDAGLGLSVSAQQAYGAQYESLIYLDVTYKQKTSLSTSSSSNIYDSYLPETRTLRFYPVESQWQDYRDEYGSDISSMYNYMFARNQSNIFRIFLSNSLTGTSDDIVSITLGNSGMDASWELDSLAIYPPDQFSYTYERLSPSGDNTFLTYGHPLLKMTENPILYYKPSGGFRITNNSRLTIPVNSQGLVAATGDLQGLINDASHPYRPFEPSVNYGSTYLFEMKTSDLDKATTNSDMQISITYESNNNTVSTVDYQLSESLKDFYVNSYGLTEGIVVDVPTYLPQLHKGETVRFLMNINDVKRFISATITLTDTAQHYQFDSVNIYQVSSLGYTKSYYSYYGSLANAILGKQERDFTTGTLMAGVSRTTYLNAGSTSKSLNFIDYSSGEAVETPDESTQGLTSIKKEMAYNEINRDLKLATAKSNYTVNVQVSSITDAGSTNYFFFQLVFENGTSGVVLANEQIAGDAFRQGETASFSLSTNQYYGQPKSIRIYTHSTNVEDATAFDKLSIDNIEIIRQSGIGLASSWVIENVGWIDINYTETDISGQNTVMNTTSDTSSANNTSVCKEYYVTKNTAAMNFMVEFEVHSTTETLEPNLSANIHYIKTNGASASLSSLNINYLVDEYNGESGAAYVKNTFSRFYVDISDVAELREIEFISDKPSDFVISNLKVYRVAEKGDVYLDSTGRYNRTGTLTPITRGSIDTTTIINNSTSTTVSLDANENMSVSFEVSSDGETSFTTGSTTASNVQETLNIYVYPGNNSSFRSNLSAALRYSGIYESGYMQKTFTIPVSSKLESGVLCIKGVDITNLGSVSSLILSCEGNENPSVSHAIVERIRNGRKVNSYYIDFSNVYLISPTRANVDYNAETDEMKQTITITTQQLDPIRISKTDDIGVSIRYRSSIDNSVQYLSEYVYLSDQAKNSLSKGSPVTLNLYEQHVGEITGISIITTGNMQLTTDTVYACNYNKYDELLYATGITIPLSFDSSSGNINKAFYHDTSLQNPITVMPVIFTMETAADAGTLKVTGTYSKVYGTLVCTDPNDASRTVEISLGNIRDYFSSSNSDYADIFQSGRNDTFTAYLAGTGEPLELRLRMDSNDNDPWTLSGVTVRRKLPDGTYEVKSGNGMIVSAAGEAVIDLRVADADSQINSQISGDADPSSPTPTPEVEGPSSETTVSGNN